MGTVRPVRARVILLSLVLVLAACSGGHAKHAQCATRCTGTIHGANYAIVMPKKWNGTLLLFSHAYRQRESSGAMLPTVSLGDANGKGNDPLGRTLLAQGYALAGSSYSAQGWATADALRAANDVYRRFVSLHGKPKRTLAWGASLGGLVTELIAERADWVDGAAALCGVVGGPTQNFDNMLEAAWATKVLLDPQLQLTGFTSAAAASAQGTRADQAIAAAARDRTGDRAARALFIADLVGMPDRTVAFAAGTPGQSIAAKLQALVQYVGLAFSIRYDMELRFGGNAARTSADVTQISSADAVEIAALHGNVQSYAAMLAAAAPVSADPKARAAATASGDPSGLLRVPLITLHDVYDPLAIVANESVLASRVDAAGASSRLVQSFVGAGGSAYGLGHCAFSVQQVAATIDQLDSWVRTGRRPAQDDLAAAAGGGIDESYTPPSWPGAG
jgi:hypothetical protein